MSTRGDKRGSLKFYLGTAYMEAKIISKIRKFKVVVALMLTLLLSASMWNWYDINIFENWVKALRYTKLYRLYEAPLVFDSPSYRVVYPPVPPLTYIATRYLVDWAANAIAYVVQAVPSVGEILLVAANHVLRVVAKLPLLLFTVLLAILLWRRLGSEAFYWAIMGVPTIVTLANYQFDPLTSFSLYLAMICLDIPRVWLLITSLATATVVLTKPLAAIALAPLIYYIYRSKGLNHLIAYTLVSSVIVAAVALPFFLVNPYAFIYNVILFHSERPPQYVSLWNVFVLLSNRDPLVIEIVNIVWLPTLAIALMAAFLTMKRSLRTCSKDLVILTSLTLTLLVLTLNKVVNPNYLLWAYPMVIHVAFSRGLRLRKALILYNLAAALAALWGGLYVLIPALVNGTVIIEETGELLQAREFLNKSLDTPLNETVQSIIRVSEKYSNYIELLEAHMNILGALVISIYGLAMLYLATILIRKSEEIAKSLCST